MPKRITPSKAIQLLEIKGPQRAISESAVTRYLHDMTAGRWRDDVCPPIYVDAVSGAVLDGRTRLTAVSRLPDDQAVRFEVKSIDVADRLVLDTGRPRSLADTLKIMGYPNTKFLSAFLNTSSVWGGRPAYIMSRSEQVDWLTRNPNSEKAAAVTSSLDRHRTKRKIARVPIGVTATLWDIAQFGVGGDTVVEFVKDVEISATTQPSKSLQDKLRDHSNVRTQTRISPTLLGFMVARTYTAWLSGEELRKLYGKRTSLFSVPGYSEWLEHNWVT